MCYVGDSCRSRVTNILSKQFEYPALAEKHYKSILPIPSFSAMSASIPTVYLPPPSQIVYRPVIPAVHLPAVDLPTVSLSAVH